MSNSSAFHSHFPPTGYPTVPGRGAPFTEAGGSSSSDGSHAGAAPPDGPQFDIFQWYPEYQSCQRYFLNHAQHSSPVQHVAALVNICLPFQWPSNPIYGNSPGGAHPPAAGPAAYALPWPRPGPVPNSQSLAAPAWVSLVPYIRRLIVTGMDTTGVMHGFFGEDWKKGVGPLHECERRNYLFAAKSGGWAKVKCQYDMSPHESVPFLKPLQDVQLAEIEGAERTWSQWLAMEDWMVGPRAPDADDRGQESAGRRAS